MNIEAIQAYLVEHELDGWLLADFHGRNDIAVKLLNLSGIITRRSFYFIPAQGQPVGLVNAIEKPKFQNLPGKIIPYAGYHMMESELKKALAGSRRVAMEYSPNGRLPYIGLVDAGTVEMIRGMVGEVVSSADLVANFQARLTVEQIAQHRIAARNLREMKDKMLSFVKSALTEGRSITEYDVCKYGMDQMGPLDMESHDSFICGIDANAGNPHYEPSPERAAKVGRNQLLLLDLWAKLKQPNAPYADITWMAYTGPKEAIPEKYHKMFGVLAEARDKAVAFLRDNIEKRPVYGYEVDDVCRNVIKAAGYGDYFTHRTGHSITTEGHGAGPNIDNLETEDRRKLQKGHLFSVEPGIYMSDCGFRTEIDCLISHEGCEVTTLPLQTEITPLF